MPLAHDISSGEGIVSDNRNLPSGHPPVQTGRIGVLLVNLGTPDGTDVPSVRRYLREFLSDRRVIEVPKLIWWFILNLFIVTFRSPKTAKAYAKIWRTESDESPLRYYTRQQAEALAARFTGDATVTVDWAMRYGQPSIPDRLTALKDAGAERILVFPLYPQYSATTTATVVDKVADTLRGMRWQPTLRFVPPYHDDPAYIGALAGSVQDARLAQGSDTVLLASFHGLPQAYFDKGDPYHCHCHKTARLLRERLGLDGEQLRLSFQSRFGPKAWLQPYTDATLEELAQAGRTSVAVLTPGFAADCVETLEEIAIEGRAIFEEAGGKDFTMIPCLNDSDRHVDMLEEITRRELSGWL